MIDTMITISAVDLARHLKSAARHVTAEEYAYIQQMIGAFLLRSSMATTPLDMDVWTRVSSREASQQKTEAPRNCRVRFLPEGEWEPALYTEEEAAFLCEFYLQPDFKRMRTESIERIDRAAKLMRRES